MAPGAPQEGPRGAGETEQDEVPQPQREREEAGVLEEDDGVEEAEEEEEAPTHLPFAPSSELLDDATTVDPSYTISLIRQLIPQGSNVEKEFSVKQGVPEENDANPDNGEPSQPENKDPWEEGGCILWDLAASKPQAELMMNNLVLEVILVNFHVTQSPRVKEICLGIMGNLACHESLVNTISLQNGLTATVVDQLFLDDSACLSETFRFLATVLRSNASASWAEALLPDEVLSRVLWIVGNTLNSTLLEKSIDFLSTVIDNQDVTAVLLQPLIKMGLVNHAISLLASEIEKVSDESKLDRSASLDLILDFIEELSAIDSCSEEMSSSDQLIQVLDSIVKLPDKFEVPSYCASVVIILANLLADGKHIVPMLSHDLPFLEGLFDILPLISDDKQARNALWCILSHLLAQAQGIDTNSSSLEHFVSLLLGRFTLIKDDLESQRVDKEEDLSAEDAYLKQGLRAICCVMERWIAEKTSLGKEDASLTENTIENARKILSYCQNYDL
ncbi:uncharacterized protein LOC133915710 isoform X2 [Phragmites australis]|uniref:uncharacterized protein LOC133915710 isoform X2 n=1 Tax=Phragmites australis TaxID=29695 RepID=UPI002D77E2F1|nr:uncharacterized protein LOC133915710 isoform X2 [Phragmites australis]